MNWDQIFNETWRNSFWDAFGKWITGLVGISHTDWPPTVTMGWLTPILLFTLALPLGFLLVELALSAMGFSSPGEALHAAGVGINQRMAGSRFNSGMSGPGRNGALSPFMDYSSDKLDEPISSDGNRYPASFRAMMEPGTTTLKDQTTADRVAMREQVAQNSTPEEMQKYDAMDNGGMRQNKDVWQ
jgi:hypothetical protein